jgi:hypothetical protein
MATLSLPGTEKKSKLKQQISREAKTQENRIEETKTT